MEPARGRVFQRTRLHWMVLITFLCVMLTWAVFWPQQVPYEALGPIGAFSKHMVEHHSPLLYYGWWFAWSIHVAEAVYSLKLCRDKGINSLFSRFLWCLQTFLFGIASLSLLLKYRPDPRPKCR
ncbi:transmembrane protein 254-like isoform X1 [Acipenser oxyrinchus oxyrinchus]|uniref:Transmembrane protein 254 n=1 Tax=Acipenser oxyrinchus oxyrinchus TaxID=40147 RepID=A0AAD8DEI2_ACIOX|nr:transmembrane protein 254-like isoform X1 [Acipenser oxyrinchus oxyrinchus]